MAVCAAIRPKSSGVTSRSPIWSRYSRELGGIDFGFLGLAQLAGLGVHDGALVDRLDDQVRLQTLGDDQFDHTKVGGLAVHLHARVLGRAGLLLVGGEQRVLERDHQLLGLDALLARQRMHGFQDFA